MYNFIPPDATRIAEALGDIEQLPNNMQQALQNKINESFQQVPLPDEDDWLKHNFARGQTIKTFERNTRKAIPRGIKKTIYIQPVGNFNRSRTPSLQRITKFVRAFFPGCKVELLKTVDFPKDMTYRINEETQQIQYRSGGFLNYLSQTRSQRDIERELLCVAVTMTDIYPEEDCDFIYGQARLTDIVAVYSFARLDPLFPKPLDKLRKISLTKEHRVIILRRCVKILLHEIGHLFGLEHCIYYICLMNGSNNEKEMDRQPLYLCPVCLRKLHSTLQFDVRRMYKAFVKLCEKYDLEEESIWYRKRLDCIQK